VTPVALGADHGHDSGMYGLMQDAPLTINSILARGEQYFPTKTIVTGTAAGLQRTTLGELAAGTRKVVSALDSLDLGADARVGTFGWNTARHIQLYFAIPGSGRIMHTGNLRYAPEQFIYTVNHAEDEAFFVDRSLLPLFAKYLPSLDTVRHVVVMDDGAPCEIPDDPRIVRWKTSSTAPTASIRPSFATGSRTRTRRPPCATRPVRPATRRASCTATARPGCTRWRR